MKHTVASIASLMLAVLVSSCAEPAQAPKAGPETARQPVAALPAAKPTPAAKPAAPSSRPATALPTTAPSGPPRILVTVGKAKIMSDRLEGAMAAIKRRWAARKTEPTSERVQQAKEGLYKNWIQEAIIDDYLSKQTLPPEAVEYARRGMAKQAIIDRLIEEYLSNRRAPNREEIEAKAEELLNVNENVQEAIRSYQKFKNWNDEQLELILKLRALEAMATTREKAATFVERHSVSYFDGTKLTVRHLLIAYKPYDPPEVKQAAQRKIRALAKAIRSGKLSFEKIARQHSDCPSAGKGGEFGPFPLSGVPERFAAAANTLKPGGMSGPFETFFGWHFIQLIERTEGDGTVGPNAEKIAKDILQGQVIREIITKSAPDSPVTIHESPTVTAADLVPFQIDRHPTSAPATRPASTRPLP